MNKLILTLVIVIAFVAISFLASERASLAQSGPKKTPLKLTISTESRICSGKPITIEAKLENLAEENTTIDTRYVRRYGTEIAHDQSSSNIPWLKIPKSRIGFGDSIDIEDLPKEYFVTLKPGESFKESYVITRAKDDFFKLPGKYSITIGYGQFKDWSAQGFNLFIGRVDSNELEFQILDCENTCSGK